MRTNEFISQLRRLELGVFTTADAAKVLGGSRAYVNLFLHRLAARHEIERIGRGVYALKGAGRFEIANAVEPNGYISGIAALFYYGMINQDPLVIDIVSARRSFAKEIKYGESTISVKVIKISIKRFFGFRKEKGSVGYFLIAEPEKAILDTLYIYRNRLASYCKEAFENGEGKIDKEKLAEYAHEMRSSMLIGMLDKIGIDVGDVHAGRIRT
jgi:predicted transcriptional regulator of viral defense system